MSINPARASQAGNDAQRPTMAEIIDRLSRFDGPPEQFLVNLLAVQCYLASAGGGAILRVSAAAAPPPPQADEGPPAGDNVEVLAVYPQPAEGAAAPVWLAESAELAPHVVAGGKPMVRGLHKADDLYGAPANQNIILLPLRGGSGVQGMAAFIVTTSNQQQLDAARERLELTLSLLSLYEMRLTLQQRQGDLTRLRLAMETTAAVNEQERFDGAAMALCNEISSRWKCDRVSLGFLKGRYVHLKAMSHTEKFSRKMKLVQDIESAMEETLDQDVEVVHPADPNATFVQRAADELSKRHGPTAVLSLPLRHDGQVASVVTLERPMDQPFQLEEIEAMRLAADLITPRLVSLHVHDRWFGARAAGAVRKGLASLVGSKHTWIKVAAIAVIAAGLFLVFAKGDYRAEASFVLEPVAQQVHPAPFEGYLKEVYVRPGDPVVGTGGREKPTWLLGSKDVLNWPVLLGELHRHHSDDDTRAPARARIWSMLTDPTRRKILAATNDEADAAITLAVAGPDETLKETVLKELNDALTSRGFYETEAWSQIRLSARQRDLLETASLRGIEGDRLVELNRSLLVSAMDDAVSPGPTVLGTLETAELRLELKSAEAEWLGYRKQKDAARHEDKRADIQIAQARADQIAAKMGLLSHRISQAVIVASIDGHVVSGDLRRQLGSPVKTGDVLFEVAALAILRAELSVPEDLIVDVKAAYDCQKEAGEELRGELATTAKPDERIRFVVERINPIAEVVGQSNVFKVRARLLEKPSKLRPGMEGLGKIYIERRSYGFIWTRRMINWIRMKLWI